MPVRTSTQFIDILLNSTNNQGYATISVNFPVKEILVKCGVIQTDIQANFANVTSDLVGGGTLGIYPVCALTIGGSQTSSSNVIRHTFQEPRTIQGQYTFNTYFLTENTPEPLDNYSSIGLILEFISESSIITDTST